MVCVNPIELNVGDCFWELVGEKQRLIRLCSLPEEVINFKNKKSPKIYRRLIKWRDGKTIHAGHLLLGEDGGGDIYTTEPQQLIKEGEVEVPWSNWRDSQLSDWDYYAVQIQMSGVSEYFCSFSFESLTSELIDYLYDEVETSITYTHLKNAMAGERWRWIEEVVHQTLEITSIRLF